MYRLYYYPRNASLAPHLLLEELGVDFELVLVDRNVEAQKSDDYLRLNPTGRIPTLVDGELVLFESAAICLHLCDRHPEAGFMPPLGSAARPAFFQWLFYLTSTVQSELMVFFYPEKHTGDAAATAAIVAAQDKRLVEMFGLLDAAIGERAYLAGDQISVCDLFLLMLSLWAGVLSKPPTRFTNLGRYLADLAERKAVRRVFDKEQIDLSTFFSL